MRSREDPRRWPVCIALAAVLLLAVPFLIPRTWIDALLRQPLRPGLLPEAAPPRTLVLLPVEIVTLKPVLEPESEPPDEDERPQPQWQDEDAWWRTVWQVGLQARNDAALGRASRPDSALATRLELLGGLTDLLRRVEPDSATADVLARLYLEDGFRMEGGLKTFLACQGYALDHADLKSREADMFDEHLFQSIPVTDSLADKLREESGDGR
jgi:hypothetical protein